MAYTILFKNGWDVNAACEAPFPKPEQPQQSWIASWFVSPAPVVDEMTREERFKQYVEATFAFDLDEGKENIAQN